MAKILYFAPLADMLHKEAAQLAPAPELTTVCALLAHVRKRGNDWSLYLADNKVQVTISR